MVGVWNDIAHRGFLEKYKWFVKVDDDCYVRPGMLRRGLARYGDDQIVTAWQDDQPNEPAGTDGFLIAIPHGYIGSLIQELNRRHSMCDQVLSGHDEHPQDTAAPPDCNVENNFTAFLDEHGNSLVVADV